MPPPDDFDTLAAIAEADALIRAHDQPAAVARLERALKADAARAEGPPARSLYIRLAGLYRGFERFRDEMALLESYLSRYPDDGQRTRFHSRLSKLQAIIASTRTSSVVPVNHAGRTRTRQTRLAKRLVEHGRRLEEAGLPGPAAASVRLREHAAALIERSAASLQQSAASLAHQAQLLVAMTVHCTALRALMADYGAQLARDRVPREEIGRLVRALARTADVEVPEVAMITAEAERWCLDAYDAA
jgi:tetratricopeptide (TPR) repeat protein